MVREGALSTALSVGESVPACRPRKQIEPRLCANLGRAAARKPSHSNKNFGHARGASVVEGGPDRPHPQRLRAHSWKNKLERRAKPARRSSRFTLSEDRCSELHQSRSVHQNQNPQNGQHRARFDWGLGAICFGASPVAAVFGSAPGARLPRNIESNITPPFRSSPQNRTFLLWQRIGHFYFALTSAKEIAFLCGVSVGTITHLAVKWRKSGGAEGIPAIKIGKLWRFRKAEVLEWLSEPHPPYRAAVESGNNPVQSDSSAKELWDDDYGRWADDGGNNLD